MNLYFDESGNSGENLLDKEQPVFVLLSHNLSQEQSLELLNNFDTNSDEIHFKKIRRYYKNHQKLIDVLNSDLIDYSSVKIAYYYKKFAICAHLVDQVVETYYFKNGMSFYEESLNIKYANALYMYCESFELQYEFNKLLELFQKMFRDKTIDSIDEFYELADIIKVKFKDNEEGTDFIHPISDSRRYIDEILSSEKKYRMELTIPSITILCDIWYKETGNMIDIIHDESKSLKEWEDTILELSDQNIPQRQIGLDTRTMTFPLPITSITRVDSKDYPQVQLADLIGSAFAYYAKCILLGENIADPLAILISESKLANIPVHPLSPDFD